MKFNIYKNFPEEQKIFSDKINKNFSEWDFQKIFSKILKFLPEDKKNFLNKINKNSDFFDEKEINLFFVSDKEIQNLNKNFRNKNFATDCLSFEKDDEWKKDAFDPVFWECFIAMPYIENQAEEFWVSFRFEVTKMVAHSVLHVFGYDHIEDWDFVEMNELEKKILWELKNEEFFDK